MAGERVRRPLRAPTIPVDVGASGLTARSVIAVASLVTAPPPSSEGIDCPSGLWAASWMPSMPSAST